MTPSSRLSYLRSSITRRYLVTLSADIDECMRSQGLPQELKSGFNKLNFTRQDIIESLGELDPFSAAPDGEIPARILTACEEKLADLRKVRHYLHTFNSDRLQTFDNLNSNTLTHNSRVFK